MPYTCTWSHNSTAITMVNQPVLNQEWDFSLGAERSHNEGTCRQGGEQARRNSQPHAGSQLFPALATVCPGSASVSDICVPPTVGALMPAKGKAQRKQGMNSRG